MGLPEELIAKLTRFGQVIVYPGKETRNTNMLFSRTFLHGSEKLCSLDC